MARPKVGSKIEKVNNRFFSIEQEKEANDFLKEKQDKRLNAWKLEDYERNSNRWIGYRVYWIEE